MHLTLLYVFLSQKEVRSTPLALGRREVIAYLSWFPFQCTYLQDVDTSLVKLLAEDRSPSLVPYIENHELHLAFEETHMALEKNSVRL